MKADVFAGLTVQQLMNQRHDIDYLMPKLKLIYIIYNANISNFQGFWKLAKFNKPNLDFDTSSRTA